jgi:hypothetical protein
MTPCFELAEFTVRDGEEDALIAERPAMIRALQKAFPGALAAWLTKRDDGGSMSSSGGVGRTPRTPRNASTASQRRTSGFDTSASRMASATSRSSTNTSSRSHAPTQ